MSRTFPNYFPDFRRQLLPQVRLISMEENANLSEQNIEMDRHDNNTFLASGFFNLTLLYSSKIISLLCLTVDFILINNNNIEHEKQNFKNRRFFVEERLINLRD